MAYHIYQTTSFVLGRTPIGEANAYISLLTRDMGLVKGVARSVRSEKSKLRYALQKYSESEVSLVRGKDVWRITGAVPVVGYGELLTGFPERRALLARVSRLVLRLHGEEHNPYAFDSVQSLLESLEEFAGKETDLELVTVIRLLYAFGYVGKEGILLPYVENAEIRSELLEKIGDERDELVSIVNQALAASSS